MDQEKFNYRWVILAVCWFGYIIAMMQRLSIGPLAPFLKEGLDLTHTQIGLFTSAIGIGYMAVIIPGGIIVDKTNRKLGVVLSFCEIMGGLFICCMFFIKDLNQGLLLMCLCGFGLGTILPATSKAIMTWFPADERATAMGVKHTSINIGGILASVILPPLCLAFSWRHAFFIIGLVGIVTGIITYLYYKPYPDETIDDPATVDGTLKTRHLIKNVFKNRDLMLLAFVGVFVSVEFAIVTYFVLFITESLKYAVVTAGLLLAVLEGGGAFGKPLFGLISDRIFKGSRKKVYLIITATWFLCSLVLVFIKAGHSLWVLIPLCVILGASCIGWSGIHFTFIAEIAGKALVGSATSICMLFAGIAGILWPPIIGKIIDATGSYSLSWLVISVAGAIATLLLLFIREEKKLL